jgi:hypothetical protein
VFVDQMGGKPRPKGRGRIARTAEPSLVLAFERLGHRHFTCQGGVLLLFNVLANDFEGSTATASGKKL